MINELTKKVYAANVKKGFWEEPRELGTILMLITSEVVEALEADRKGKFCEVDNENWVIDGNTLREDIETEDIAQFISIFERCVKDTFEDELADTMIRIFDLCGAKDIDLEWHIKQKMRYNETRPFKHGKKY